MGQTQKTQTSNIIIGFVIIAAAIIIAALILSQTVVIHNTGTINTIGFTLWADANRTTTLATINWGSLNPGDTHAVLGWAQNTQNVNFTLSFVTYNWNPTSAQQYLVFGWNYTGQIIQPSQIVPLQITLQALPNVTGITTFSFDINMTAVQA